MGFDITWIIECKQWETKVSKIHILALREIINDLGADRGNLLTEQGFQSDALEVAALPNVHVTSIEEVSKITSNEIFSMRLGDLSVRLNECKINYWNIPKPRRTECGLRPDVGVPGHSGTRIIEVAEKLFAGALGSTYLFDIDKVSRIIFPQLPPAINSIKELVMLVEPLLDDLEYRLNNCKEGKR